MFEKPLNIDHVAENLFITRENFNDQLEKTQIINAEMTDANIEYVKINPDKLSDNPPALFVGGFGQGRDSYTEEMFNLANEGRVVLFSNPRRGLDTVNEEKYKDIKEQFGISDSVLAKALEIEAILDHEEYSNIDLIGHSQGGLVLTVLSLIRPDLAKNLVLESTQGFQGNLSTGQLAGKFAVQGIKQMIDNTMQFMDGDNRPMKISSRVFRSFLKEASVEPLWRLSTEVPGSAKVDIVPILANIKSNRKESGSGPQIALLNSNNDGLFPPEIYENGLDFDSEPTDLSEHEEVGPFKFIDTWVMYSRKGAGHNAAAVELPGLLRQVLQSEDVK